MAALLLLSQQEERHLLEKNINAALQKKVDELQRNLLQVTFSVQLRIDSHFIFHSHLLQNINE